MRKFLSNSKPVAVSVLWAVVILVFYVLAGVITTINKSNETNTMLIRGVCVWGAVALAAVYIGRSRYSFRDMGFRKMEPDVIKKFMFFLPAIAIEAVGTVVGFRKINALFVLAVFFFTLAVGFAEEIYFRGIILKVLEGMGVKTAVIISSIIFGVTHMGNIAGGEGVFKTLIQVVFAFVFGIVFAELFLLSKSLIPVIAWHFLHDFTSFLQNEPDMNAVLPWVTLQTVLLIVYAIFMWNKLKTVKTQENAAIKV